MIRNIFLWILPFNIICNYCKKYVELTYLDKDTIKTTYQVKRNWFIVHSEKK